VRPEIYGDFRYTLKVSLMLALISPAKTLDYETPLPTSKSSKPLFMNDSAELIDILKGYKPKQVAKLMSISDKLADLNVDRYAAWEPKATKKNARQAVLAFKGDVYQGMDAWSFKDADFDFAQDNLGILSGLYGLLRPLDLMQPYRLEMGTKLKTERGNNLYDFWAGTITDAVNKQIKKSKSEALLNLASNEYFKSVHPGQISVPIISPVFKDNKNGKYKIISFFAKKARGTMAGWMIRKKITNPAKLSKFAEDGYRYEASESTPAKPVFLRG